MLAHISSDGETSTSLAAAISATPTGAGEINAYNGRQEAPLERGEILLVPLLDLSLTEAGKTEARAPWSARAPRARPRGSPPSGARTASCPCSRSISTRRAT